MKHIKPINENVADFYESKEFIEMCFIDIIDEFNATVSRQRGEIGTRPRKMIRGSDNTKNMITIQIPIGREYCAYSVLNKTVSDVLDFLKRKMELIEQIQEAINKVKTKHKNYKHTIYINDDSDDFESILVKIYV